MSKSSRMPRTARSCSVRGAMLSPWLKPDRNNPTKMSGLNLARLLQTPASSVTRPRMSPTWASIPCVSSSRDSNRQHPRFRKPRPPESTGSPLRYEAVGMQPSKAVISRGSRSSPNSRNPAFVRPMLPPTETYMPSGRSPCAGSHSAFLASSCGSQSASDCESLVPIYQLYTLKPHAGEAA